VVTDAQGNPVGIMLTPPPTYSCTTVYETVYDPGSPGTPPVYQQVATTSVTTIPGTPGVAAIPAIASVPAWDAVASSQSLIYPASWTVDFAGTETGVVFKVPSSTLGAIVGLSNDMYTDASIGPTGLLGFAFIRGYAHIWGPGRGANFDQSTLQAIDGLIIGAYTDTDVFMIQASNQTRSNQSGAVMLYKNGQAVASIPASAFGPFRVFAFLYSDGDSVVDANPQYSGWDVRGYVGLYSVPAVIGGGSSAGAWPSYWWLPDLFASSSYSYGVPTLANLGVNGMQFTKLSSGMQAQGGNFVGGVKKYARGSAVLKPLKATGGQKVLVGSNAVMQPMTALGGRMIGQGTATFQPMRAHGNSAMSVAFRASTAYTSFSPLAVGGHGLTGTVGGGAAVLHNLEAIGSKGVRGMAHASFMPLVGYATGGVASPDAQLVSLASASLPLTAVSEIYVVMDSYGEVVGLLTLEKLLVALLESNATINDTQTTTQVLQAAMLSLARGGSLSLNDTGYTVWAMTTTNSGTTRYKNFDFTSFAKIGTKYYGVRRDGLYLLDGPADAGTLIDASVNFGKTDFDTTLKKSLTQCYVGVASSNTVVLKVVADGTTYYYTARNSSSALAEHRIDLGRGFRANYFELELQNLNGSAFELADIEFTPIPLSRRI
jgi:hypothetical protein